MQEKLQIFLWYWRIFDLVEFQFLTYRYIWYIFIFYSILSLTNFFSHSRPKHSKKHGQPRIVNLNQHIINAELGTAKRVSDYAKMCVKSAETFNENQLFGVRKFWCLVRVWIYYRNVSNNVPLLLHWKNSYSQWKRTQLKVLLKTKRTKMSLTVRIIQFQLPKPKNNLIGRVEFRGKSFKWRYHLGEDWRWRFFIWLGQTIKVHSYGNWTKSSSP